ncbi:MAG: peptide deformylase, partial [Bacteroidales bacterium]|nr:peptide deformylase [Bacteroidales bacterium]
MVLPIYVYGQQVLREIAKPVDPNMEGLDTLLSDMYETMKNADGVGIAAPQVGKSLRVV